MRSRSLAEGIALAAVLVFCVSATLEFAQTQHWYKYGLPARYQASAVYDSASDIMVIFGGQHISTELDFNDIWWAFNLVKGSCQPPCDLELKPPPHKGTSPSPRFGHTAVYDSASTRMIVFGGATGFPSPCANDTYVLADATGVGGTATWDPVTPAGTLPAARYSHTAVYDSINDRMIVFGGNNCGSTYFNDVWVLSGASGLGSTPAWSQLSPTGTLPPARSLSSAVYDETNNRMVVFGGTNGSLLGDVWVLTNANGLSGTPAWVQLAPTGTAPMPRSGHTAVYDAINNLMIVYGGTIGTNKEASDTWVLSDGNGLGGTPAWTLTVPGGGSSPLLTLHSAVYDPASNKMLIFGGFEYSNGTPNDEFFVLNNANGL
jgi:Galactose oxidase, central domain